VLKASQAKDRSQEEEAPKKIRENKATISALGLPSEYKQNSLWAAKKALLNTKQGMFYDGDRNAAPYFLMPNTDKIFLLNEDKM
jgi:hypothetical protein